MVHFLICLSETLAGYRAKLLEQVAQHQAMEASLLDQLHEAQQEQRDAVEMCKGQWSMFRFSQVF